MTSLSVTDLVQGIVELNVRQNDFSSLFTVYDSSHFLGSQYLIPEYEYSFKLHC